MIGEIGYTISPYDIPEMSSQLKDMVNSLPLLVEMPNDKRLLAVSREALQYSDFTKALIIGKLSNVRQELIEKVKELIEAQPSLREACSLLYSVLPFYFRDQNYNLNFTWKGWRVQDRYDLNEKVFSLSYNYSRTRIQRYEIPAVKIDYPIVINDLQKKSCFHAEEVMKKLGCNQIYYYFLEKGDTLEDLLKREPLLSQSNLAPKLLSEIYTPKTKAEKATSDKKAKGFIQSFVYDGTARNYKSSGIYEVTKKLDIDVEAEGVYCKIVGLNQTEFGIENNLGGHSISNESLLINAYKILGKPIYCIRECNVEKLGDRWVHLNQALNQKIEDSLEATAAKEGFTFVDSFIRELREMRLKRSTMLHRPLSNYWGDSNTIQLLRRNISAFSPVYLLISQMAKAEYVCRTLEKESILAMFYSLEEEPAGIEKEESSFKPLLLQIKKRYPLINYLMEGLKEGSVEAQPVIDYINMIDKYSP